jgi:chemotaxis signal transduction protein
MLKTAVNSKRVNSKRVVFETIDPESTLRVVVAPFKNLWVALPMAVTRKIVRLSEEEAQLATGDRIQVDNFSAQIFRLYEHIYDEPNPQPESHCVILHLSPTHIVAITMTQVPAIVNLPKVALEPISADYRELYMLNIASHITLMERPTEDVTVFILDMEKLIGLLPDDPG